MGRPDLAGKYRLGRLRCQRALYGVELLSECIAAPRDDANAESGKREDPIGFHLLNSCILET